MCLKLFFFEINVPEARPAIQFVKQESPGAGNEHHQDNMVSHFVTS
jgi:hypothetical protein